MYFSLSYQQQKFSNIFFLTVMVIMLLGCHRRNDADPVSGYLNLHFKYTMHTYTSLQDPQCGCSLAGEKFYTHYSPTVMIINEQGQIVFNEYSPQVNLDNFPLPEGKYSIQYRAKLFNYLPCDSARDIWKITINNGSEVYCLNRNKYNYKDFDSTENFEITRFKTTVLLRDF